jgi:TonB family protein
VRISNAFRLPLIVHAGIFYLLFASLLPLSGQEARKILTRVPPTYPPAAKSMHISGQVHIDATVAPDGHVEKAKATSGHPMLAAAAQTAVERWKFAPGSATEVVPVIVVFQSND